MPKQRKGDQPRKGGGDDDSRDEQQPGEPQPRKGNPDADPVKIHRDFVQRRQGGGAPATPEAYERALREWHQLPGAVRAPATESSGGSAPPAGNEEQEKRGEEGEGDDQTSTGPGL